MIRRAFLACLCLLAGGCVSNSLSTQNQQIAPPGGGYAPPPPPRPVQHVEHLTPAARLTRARFVTMTKTAMSGVRLTLASPMSLSPDCTPLGEVTAQVIAQPEHGTIRIEKGMAFPNFSPGDPPFGCNGARAPATLISYRSEKGFVGQDSASVQVFFPSGQAPTLIFHINVR